MIKMLEKSSKITIESSKMKVGDTMKVVSPKVFVNQILLKTYGNIVSLNNPSMTWSSEDARFIGILVDIECKIIEK